MYAVVEIGGKQYIVEQGSVIKVEKLDAPEGHFLEVDKILFLKTDDGSLIGSPYVEGAKVRFKVLEHGKDKKIIVFKYKRKKNYRRKRGHRQLFTKLEVENIVLS
ncbi:MAG: 50S ribosomal protein L21 [Clostridia bacterium]|nr:MAG: 50S ribosomal protein L21 [bacterium 42_11]MBC7332227.1 50S ribosomal protein L21 [Synergistota bacterium]MBC7338125.1 50S ribosomal protein L21 [Clostridia bacterium]MDK2871944.1 large subunit ribosomal protein [bacterium]